MDMPLPGAKAHCPTVEKRFQEAVKAAALREIISPTKLAVTSFHRKQHVAHIPHQINRPLVIAAIGLMSLDKPSSTGQDRPCSPMSTDFRNGRVDVQEAGRFAGKYFDQHEAEPGAARPRKFGQINVARIQTPVPQPHDGIAQPGSGRTVTKLLPRCYHFCLTSMSSIFFMLLSPK